MAQSDVLPRRTSTTGSLASQSPNDAFVELHGRRLYGFALLLTLGDRPRSTRLAWGAMAAAQTRLAELRHPERAAAWLRASVVRAASRGRRSASADSDPLEELDVTGAALRGLSVLTLLERAALIATVIERMDGRDVSTVVSRTGERLERLLQRAIRRYLAAATELVTDLDDQPGAVRRRVAAATARTLR